MPRISGLHYRAFIDPSGGSAELDHLGHRARGGWAERARCRARNQTAIFTGSRGGQVRGASEELWGVQRDGDRCAGEWQGEQFRKAGIEYPLANRPKSDTYRDLLPLLNSGKVELLDLPRLSMQLVGLERRTARSRRDSIEHAPGGQDDLANAVAGALLLASAPSGYDVTMNWVGGFDDWGLGGIMHGDFG